MQEKKIRVGIIGTGFGAKVHAPIIRGVKFFRLTNNLQKSALLWNEVLGLIELVILRKNRYH